MDDLAEACTFALESWNPNLNNENKNNYDNNTCWINVGSDNEISIKDLAQLISEIVGFKGEILWDKSKPDGTPRKLLDSTKLQESGWKRSVGLQEGIALTYSWYKENLTNLRNL